jgi:hypothetical protein
MAAMVCLGCGHYTHPDAELARVQGSQLCRCACHRPPPEGEGGPCTTATPVAGMGRRRRRRRPHEGPVRPGLLLLALLLVAFLLLVRPAWSATRCTTYAEKTLGRLHTLCDDGTRPISTYNKTLSRWESTITAPPGKTCTGRLNPRTHQWEGRCR